MRPEESGDDTQMHELRTCCPPGPREILGKRHLQKLIPGTKGVHTPLGICNTTNDGLSTGKRFRYDVADGRQVIWMSERGGWNQLYLMDGSTGAVTTQITSGPWVVRHVQRVDTLSRAHYVDTYYVDTYSQVDAPPVIETIYAGRQGSFVPKSFGVMNAMRTLGGQHSMGELLIHPEFYAAVYSAAGGHDHRMVKIMDKMWWNERGMGWPIGPQYVASSNTEHAGTLQGKLLLVVGEYDTNVDPASTMHVVNSLFKATFDLRVIPNADHTSGGPYGDRKRSEFFVHHLLSVEPPDRNVERATPSR